MCGCTWVRGGQNACCCFDQCHLRGLEGTRLQVCRGLELRGGGRAAESPWGTAASVWSLKLAGLICMEREMGRGWEGGTSKP